MDCYRLSVGHNDQVKPGHIVGAIANEANIEGQHIGPINIFDNHSEVFLPKGMPKTTFNNLKKARVMGKTLDLAITQPSAKSSKRNNTFSKNDAGEKSRSKRRRKSADSKGKRSRKR